MRKINVIYICYYSLKFCNTNNNSIIAEKQKIQPTSYNSKKCMSVITKTHTVNSNKCSSVCDNKY